MKNVLILGATSDIAMALAEKYAKHGFSLALGARNVKRLTPLKKDLHIKFNTDVELYEFDACEFASHQKFYNDLHVKPDITICVFGFLGDQLTAEKNWDDTLKIIQSNFTGAVSILNIIANSLENKKQGEIVGISSVAGERGRKSNYIYGSSKAGFTAYLSGLRNRLAHSGVHVMTVNPGFVYTKMTESLDLPKALTANPQDVANTIYNSLRKKKNVIYVKWFWRWIMLIIKLIPESVFKKLKL